ncbi:hypothetical protein tinsulaeT_10680 [Thalassotalea insulae]|uniref:Uncharacterized protein n=1 Tax=Thalassotalea insulae TaxID=2056778 RepID=A0ABQ6GP09_9GAMM|nr:hypothetical protein [Thalassotalea insulae]GLX77728.1 hypothetical protein tinsulaeT_10680 [Thalassotalea insulae]
MINWINKYLTGNAYRLENKSKYPLGKEYVLKGNTNDKPLEKTNNEVEVPSHLEVLQKIIPGEAISIYFLAISLSGIAKNQAAFDNFASFLTVIVAATIRIFQTQDTSKLSSWSTVQWSLVFWSTICCITWVYAIGGTLYFSKADYPDLQLYAQLLGFTLPMIAPMAIKSQFKTT